MQNSSNESKFELASKIVGLILVVIGMYQAIDSVTLLLSLGDQTNYYRQAGIPEEYLGILQQFDNASNTLFADFGLKLLLLSIFPIILGFYLMKPNNLFCRFTYPDSKTTWNQVIPSNSEFNLDNNSFDHKPFSMGNAQKTTNQASID